MLRDLTKTRLRAVMTAIEVDKGEHLDMGTWCCTSIGARSIHAGLWCEPTWSTAGIPALVDGSPPCGTVLCLAGWAAALFPTEVRQSIQAYACDILEIPDREGVRLFLVDEWPRDLGDAYLDADNDPARCLAVLRQRVERFIETEGRE